MFNQLNRLFGGEEIRRATELVPINPQDIEACEILVEAGKRVGKRFGIDVDTKQFSRAVTAVKSRAELELMLAEHDIVVWNYGDVRRYQARRVQPTLRERFSQSWKRLSEGFSEYMLHGWTGTISAWLVFVSVGITASYFWGAEFLMGIAADGSNAASDFPGAMGISVVLFLTINFFVTYIVGGEDEDIEDAIARAGRLYAGVLYLAVGMPLKLIAALIVPWFLRGKSNREWRTLSVKEFFGKKASSQATIVLMDTLLRILPSPTLQFEALVGPGDKRDGEAFLAIDVVGLENDKIYVWHGWVN